MKEKLTSWMLAMVMLCISVTQTASAVQIDWSALIGSGNAAEEAAASEAAGTETGETAVDTQQGFATPKEAASAYVEGFCEMNYEKMLSACAVDIFVERYDPVKQAERLRVIMPPQASYSYLPYDDPLSFSINSGKRRAMLNDMIMNQYLNVMIPGYIEKETGTPVAFEKDASASEALAEKYGDGTVPEITFKGEFISPALITERYYNYRNLKNLYQTAQVSGMENKMSVVPVIYIDGMVSLLIMEVGCYDGRWYVTEGSTLGAILGLSMTSGGMIASNIPEEEDLSGEAARGRTMLTGILSNEALMIAMEHFDEAFLKVNLPLLVMTGENDQEAAETMLETTITAAMDPAELELLMNSSGLLG